MAGASSACADELGVGRKGHRLGLNRRLGRAVVSRITLEKSVRVATDRLSWINAVRRSSPIRWRQRVSDERSKVSLCWKNSSPQKSW